MSGVKVYAKHALLREADTVKKPPPPSRRLVDGCSVLCAAAGPLAEMGEIQREVFVDHVVCGRSLREIAAERGVSESAVKLNYAKAKQRVARHLAGRPA